MTGDPRQVSFPARSDVVSSSDSEFDREPVERLAADFVERLRHGEPVTIELYARRYPQWAASIRQLFPTIAAMEGLRGFLAPVTSCPAPELQLQRLGDFRIVRELGRGGMGIVYEAEQESLRRRVAVKVLSPQLLASDKHVARFRGEAQTAAKLHHTSIVPVFGVGEHEGLHYYVMQYIDGAGLDQAAQTLGTDPTPTLVLRSHSLDTLRWTDDSLDTKIPITPPQVISIPTTPAERRRWAIDVARQVARALHYAHEQGVLHRDIKPGNLLLDPQGVVRVTDFGLATILADGGETAVHEVVGTLRYMAPEQFSARADVRSDVYGLGITLYELLIAAPAFTESNKSKLIALVRQGQLPRLGARCPGVSHDLEAVVARATAVDPAARYATAGAFADDLERLLDCRPVHARPLPPWGQALRWAQRNPLVASLHACVILLLASIAVVSTVGYRRVQESLERESHERQRANASLQMASETLDRIFTRFDPPTHATAETDDGARYDDAIQPVLSSETAAMMQNLLQYYDALASQRGDDPELRRKAAAARRRVGDIRQRLGEYRAAMMAYLEARTLQEELAQLGLDARSELARIHNELGRCYAMLDQMNDARQAHQLALASLEAWHAAAPTDRDVLYELARTHYLLGRSLRPGQSPGKLSVAVLGGTRLDSPEPPGLAPLEPREWDDPDLGPQVRGHAAPPSWLRRGGAQMVDVDHEQLYAAIRLLRQLVPDAVTGPPAFRQLLAACYRELAHDHLLRRTSADIAAERNAIELLEALVQQSPRNSDFRYDFVETLAQFDIYSAAPNTSAFEAALHHLLLAQAQAEQLLQDRPDVAEYVSAVAHLYFKLGAMGLCKAETLSGKERTAALADALGAFHRAAELQRGQLARHPELLGYRAWLVRFLLAEMSVLHRQNELAKARTIANEVDAQLNELSTATSDAQLAPLRQLAHTQRLELDQPAETLQGEASFPSIVAPGWRQPPNHGQGLPLPPGPRGMDPQRQELFESRF